MADYFSNLVVNPETGDLMANPPAEMTMPYTVTPRTQPAAPVTDAARMRSGTTADPVVLAQLARGNSLGADLGINLLGGQQSGQYADTRDRLNPIGGQPGSTSWARGQVPAAAGMPAAAPPVVEAPQVPAASPTNASDPYGILKPITDQMSADRASSFYDNLIRFGMAAMTAGGKPGATTLGALGEAGTSMLDAQNARRAADLKAVLSGAQATNLLSETGLRGSKIAAGDANLKAAMDDLAVGGGARPPFSGASVSAAAPQGQLGPNMTKIASTLQDLGHNPAQISGALGWGTRESGAEDTNPRALNNTGKDGALGGSYGWQQWLADRRDALKQFAQANEMRVDDPVTQARFFDHEMRTPGSGASETAQRAYWNANSPDEAVGAMAHYSRGEGYRPDNPQGTVRYPARLAAAQNIFGSLTGSSSPPTGPADAAGSTGTRAGAAISPAYARMRAVMAHNAGDAGGETYWYNAAKAPENYTWGPDGSLTAIAGGGADPAQVGRLEGAKEQAKVGPQIQINEANQRASGRREKDVQGAAPQKLGPTESVFYPSGSDGAKNIISAQNRGEKLPGNVTLNADGSAQVAGEVGPQIQINEANQRASGRREKDVQAAAPQKLGPTESVFYPPGSDGAKNIISAQNRGEKLPGNVTLNADGSAQVAGGSNPVFSKEIAELNAKDFFARRATATDAVKSLESSVEARKLLDSNTLIIGAGANQLLTIGRVLQQGGFHSKDDPVANTEAFAAARAAEVGRLIKQFGSGTGLSDADRQYATRMAAGDITLTELSIRRIIDIGDRASRGAIARFNQDAAQVDPRLSPYPLTVEMPPIQYKDAAGAPSGTRIIAPDGTIRIKP
jgi:hypothetical protein